jgi:predicted AlkP superfamily pyrophosphatase or phosphodiesterase
LPASLNAVYHDVRTKTVLWGPIMPLRFDSRSIAALAWFLAIAWLASRCATAAAEAPRDAKIKKVLLVGIDGCRFDAVRAANAPNLDALAAAGALSENMLILGDRFQGNDTISGPGWSSILTGVWADKHGVLDNKFPQPNFEKYPHFFRRIKDASPESQTASLVDWEPIQKYIVSAADVARVFPEGAGYLSGDEQVEREAVRLLAEDDPAALFVYFGQVDEAGHNHGFHPEVKAYRRAIERVDAHLGRVLAALRGRKNFEGESWLVLVTTDHGGKGLKHGGGHAVPEVLHSFLIVSGPAAAQGKIEGPTYLVDVVPTVLAHLGVRADPEWGLDGRAVGLR